MRLLKSTECHNTTGATLHHQTAAITGLEVGAILGAALAGAIYCVADAKNEKITTPEIVGTSLFAALIIGATTYGVTLLNTRTNDN